VIARAPRLEGYHFNPQDLVAAVNALQPLGKDLAVAALAEYLRVCPSVDNSSREGVFLILRALFEVPVDPGFLPRMLAGAPDPPEPRDPRKLPRFPLAIEGDIPFMLVHGYELGGHPQDPGDHLRYFREHGTLRAKPLAPTGTPWNALHTVLAANGSLYGTTDAGELLLGNQLLALTDPVHPRAPNASGMRAATPADWKKADAELAKLSLRWDVTQGRYVAAP
jgi:hypothetical protein